VKGYEMEEEILLDELPEEYYPKLDALFAKIESSGKTPGDLKISVPFAGALALACKSSRGAKKGVSKAIVDCAANVVICTVMEMLDLTSKLIETE
jgi:hypothetical protein